MFVLDNKACLNAIVKQDYANKILMFTMFMPN